MAESSSPGRGPQLTVRRGRMILGMRWVIRQKPTQGCIREGSVSLGNRKGRNVKQPLK